MNSLRVRLFLVLTAATAVIWLSAVVWIQHSTRAEVERVLDARLAEAARMVSSLISDHRIDISAAADIAADISPALAGTSGYSQQLSCQIWTLGGALVGRSGGAPDESLTSGGTGFSTSIVEGAPWRVFTVANPDLGVQVMVGDSLQVRDGLVADVTAGLVFPAMLILPVLAGIIWLIVGQGLRPLRRIATALSERAATDFTPLADLPLPREIRPVGAALNGLFARVAEVRERERNFTAFAAHELKTPLAGLRTQAQVAAIAPDDATRRRALDQIGRSVQRTDRMVRQLLEMARVDSEPAPATDGPALLQEIVEQVIEDVRPLAAPRGITVRTDIPAAIWFPAADRFLLTTALRNLLENAIIASPDGSEVEMAVTRDGSSWHCTVADRGPGIAPADRAHALDRFYRGKQAHPGGSGLGLAIVATAMERLGGELRLEARKGGGELATLVLPASD